MRRCLLIDLDGVLRVWDPTCDAAVESRHGLREGSILEAAFGSGSTLLEAVTGRITDEQWRADVARRLEASCGAAAAQAVVADWSRSAGAVDAEVLAVLRAARADGWQVALLSNATTRLRDDLARLGLHDELDVVLNSSDLGACKPDHWIFEEACRLLAIDPRACVFVDDSPANVSAAADVGMDAHQYRDTRSLADLLGVHMSDGTG